MNVVPQRGTRIFLAIIPFVLIAIVYVAGSAERRAANPDDKLLPPVSEMADTARSLATEPDRRTGELVLWTDTAASLQRLAIGLGIATAVGLAFGLAIGLVPTVGATLGTLIAVLLGIRSGARADASTDAWRAHLARAIVQARSAPQTAGRPVPRAARARPRPGSGR